VIDHAVRLVDMALKRLAQRGKRIVIEPKDQRLGRR
jgi:hypothetical protein